MTLSMDHRAALAEIALEETGQALRPEHGHAAAARLSRLCRREGFSGPGDLLRAIAQRPGSALRMETAEALTDKATRFFADRPALAQIARVEVPAALRLSRSGRVRILCAGGSTGQEALSLAILLADPATALPASARVEILSLDVSQAATDQASAAAYTHHEVQDGLSSDHLLAHFKRRPDGLWEAGASLKDRVSARRHNLLARLAGLGRFDIVLCRNVLGGLAPEAAQNVAANISAAMFPQSLLVTDREAGLSGTEQPFEPIHVPEGSLPQYRLRPVRGRAA